MVSLPEGSSRNFHPSNRRPLQAVGQIFGSSPQSPRSRSTALRLHRHGLGKGPLMVTENHFLKQNSAKNLAALWEFTYVHMKNHGNLRWKDSPTNSRLRWRCREVFMIPPETHWHLDSTYHPWTNTDSGHRTSQEENRLPHCLAGWLRLVDLYDPYMGHNLRYKSSYSSGNLDMLNKCRILAHSWMNAH